MYFEVQVKGEETQGKGGIERRRQREERETEKKEPLAKIVEKVRPFKKKVSWLIGLGDPHCKARKWEWIQRTDGSLNLHGQSQRHYDSFMVKIRQRNKMAPGSAFLIGRQSPTFLLCKSLFVAWEGEGKQCIQKRRTMFFYVIRVERKSGAYRMRENNG